jgi:alpha-D-ribose 1-methylphosphonate 5-triphosphate synthase subunit PhnH
MEDLNIIIHGNGLNKNGSAHFNLTRSSLKGEALRVFNNKAAEQEEKQETLIFNVSVLLQNKCSQRQSTFQAENLYVQPRVPSLKWSND